jgi:hypothetical protein
MASLFVLLTCINSVLDDVRSYSLAALPELVASTARALAQNAVSAEETTASATTTTDAARFRYVCMHA